MIKAEPNLFLIQGRINKKSMLYRTLAVVVIIGFVIANMILTGTGSGFLPMFATAAAGQLFLAVQVAKRLHDAGLSGSKAWITLIPAAGIFYAFHAATLDEQPDENEYGIAPIPDKIVMNSMQ